MVRKALITCLIVLGSLCWSTAQNPEKDIYLESMGVLSSQNIYLSYVYLGNVSDSYMHETITKLFCTNLLEEYLLIIDATKQQMTKLYESGFLDKEGNQAILTQIDIYQLLKAEAGAFLKYVTTGEKLHIEAFEQNRVRAWKKIEMLLGVKAQKQDE